MSNSYTQFCEGLDLKNDQEREWWKALLQTGDDHIDEDPRVQAVVGDPFEDEVREEVASEFCKKFAGQFHIDEPGDWPGFEYDFAEGKVYLYSDEGGNPDFAAMAIQRFLQKFHPGKDARIEVAYSCSRSMPEQFGGAAYFITKDKIEVWSTAEWLSKKWEEFHGKKPGGDDAEG